MKAGLGQLQSLTLSVLPSRWWSMITTENASLRHASRHFLFQTSEQRTTMKCALPGHRAWSGNSRCIIDLPVVQKIFPVLVWGLVLCDLCARNRWYGDIDIDSLCSEVESQSRRSSQAVVTLVPRHLKPCLWHLWTMAHIYVHTHAYTHVHTHMYMLHLHICVHSSIYIQFF